MLRARLATPFLAALLLAAPAVTSAQDRAPAERQRLLDLAYAIGQSHALRQACEGVGDQFWRARMVRLTEVEQADQTFDGQLRDRFNGGYAAAQAAHPECSPESRRAERQAALRGRALANKLSQTVRVNEQAAPDSVAEGRAAR